VGVRASVTLIRSRRAGTTLSLKGEEFKENHAMPSHEAPPPNDHREPTNVLISIVVATFIISVVGTFIATVTFIRQGNMKTRIAQLETQASLRKTTDHLDDLKGFGLKLDDVLKDLDTEPSLRDDELKEPPE
jgi:hypothetical protein